MDAQEVAGEISLSADWEIIRATYLRVFGNKSIDRESVVLSDGTNIVVYRVGKTIRIDMKT